MQREDSFLLSHSGLKYYRENEPEKFITIKQRYLTDYWIDEDEDKQIKEIAHQIRNTFNRRSIKQDRLYPDSMDLLFDVNDFISDDLTKLN